MAFGLERDVIWLGITDRGYFLTIKSSLASHFLMEFKCFSESEGVWKDHDGNIVGIHDTEENVFDVEDGHFARWAYDYPEYAENNYAYIYIGWGDSLWYDFRGQFSPHLVCQKELVPEVVDSTVDSCNNENGVIEMTATLRNVAGTYGQANDGVITFGVDELTSSFSVGFDMIVKFLLSLPVSNLSTKTNNICPCPFSNDEFKLSFYLRKHKTIRSVLNDMLHKSSFLLTSES